MRRFENWAEVKKRFVAWWARSSLGRPLMRIVAERGSISEPLELERPYADSAAKYLDIEEISKRYRNYLRSHVLYAEAYPNLSIDLGPGSMALYLGSEPIFCDDTVWFRACIQDWDKRGPLLYDPSNRWWARHLELVRRAHELAQGEYLINIPDIIENVDILAALRGPQELCFDLMDSPTLAERHIQEIDQLYFTYYDAMYDIVKLDDGSSSFTAFNVWGPGKTAKIQCDFGALMSPEQFRYFIQPSLATQCHHLDHSIYHLDGPGAIKHLDALLEIDELDAIQWTCGAGQPDGGDLIWFPLYDRVVEAQKSLWIEITQGSFEEWIRAAEGLVKRYGSNGLYLLFPVMSESRADALLERAEKYWK